MDINSFLSSFAEGTTTAEDRLRSDLKGVGEKLGEHVLAPYLIDAISRVSYFAVSRDSVGATVTLKLDAKPTEKADAEPVSAADQRAADLADEARVSLDRLKIGTVPILNDHPISLRDDLDGLKIGTTSIANAYVTLRPSVEIDPSTDAARAGIPDAAPTVEADTPTRAGIGVEDATTPAPSTSDDIVSVSISLTGDRQLVELVSALVIGGVS